MRARILPPEEWERIGGDLAHLLPYTHPRNVAVVAVEDDSGEIVAHCSVLQVTHFEGLWIKPEERKNAGVIRALLRLLYAIPEVRNERWVFAGVHEDHERMVSTCHRLGGREVPGHYFIIPLGESHG